MQRISFLGMELDSVSQTARLTQEHAHSVLNCLNTFKNRTAAPLKQFQRLLGHMAAAAAVTPLGLLHMRPLQHWLHGRVPRWAWQSGTLRVQVTPACRQTFNPWSDLSFQTSGNFMSGPWTGRGGSRWPTQRGSQHHHFGESTVYETCLRLEVEPVHRMVLFSQRRPPEMPDQSRAVLLAARVGAKAVSLHPQGLRGRDCCQPRPCGREVGGEAWLGHQVP